MGLLDSVLNELGDDAAGGIGDIVKGHGGVGGLVEAFTKGGLGDAVGSWVGAGANTSISPEQIAAVLGPGPIGDFAKKMGIPPEQAAETLAGLLPKAIDMLTPDGQHPGAASGGLLDSLPGGLGDILGGILKK